MLIREIFSVTVTSCRGIGATIALQSKLCFLFMRAVQCDQSQCPVMQ